MKSEASDTRRTGLMFLPNISARLREAFMAAGIAEEDWVTTCAQHVSGRCTVCEETLEGVEFADWLLNLGNAAGSGPQPMKFIRLARGSCGNPGCNANYYDFSLRAHENIDWADVSFGALEGSVEPETLSGVKLATDRAGELILRQFTMRAVCALGILVVFWLLHCWYNGSPIPLLRPEKSFTAQPAVAPD